MTGENAENPSLPGARLRAQRERQGLSLAQAGHELHVDQRLLAALEEDNYAALGAPIFVKGHLRNYARLLGLDPAEVVAAYEAAQQPAEPALVAHRPDGPMMDAHRSRAWVGWIGWVFLLVLGLLLAAWWYYQQEGGSDFTLSNIPERAEQADELPANDTVDDDTPAGIEMPVAGTVVGVVPGLSEETSVPVDGAADPGRSAAGGDMEPSADQAGRQPVTEAPAVRQPEVTTTRPAPAPVRNGLVLEFTAESWVEIYDAEGRPILYDLLGPGVRREINASGELRLFLGDADAVEVSVGGEPFDIAPYVRSDSTARFTVNVPAGD